MSEDIPSFDEVFEWISKEIEAKRFANAECWNFYIGNRRLDEVPWTHIRVPSVEAVSRQLQQLILTSNAECVRAKRDVEDLEKTLRSRKSDLDNLKTSNDNNLKRAKQFLTDQLVHFNAQGMLANVQQETEVYQKFRKILDGYHQRLQDQIYAFQNKKAVVYVQRTEEDWIPPLVEELLSFFVDSGDIAKWEWVDTGYQPDPAQPHLCLHFLDVPHGWLQRMLEKRADHFYRAYETFGGNSLVFLLFSESDYRGDEDFGLEYCSQNLISGIRGYQKFFTTKYVFSLSNTGTSLGSHKFSAEEVSRLRRELKDLLPALVEPPTFAELIASCPLGPLPTPQQD